LATNFPYSLDDFANPTGSSSTTDPGLIHSEQHANANDAIEALERAVGVVNSTDPNSLTKKVDSLLIAAGAYVTQPQLASAIAELSSGGGNSLNVDYTNAQDGSVLVYSPSTNSFIATSLLEKQQINGGQY